MPYYGCVYASKGVLLGGAASVESWPFKTVDDAQVWAYQAGEANRRAGRHVREVRVKFKRRDPLRRKPI